ncbi:MAG TPA: hypothetical protein PK948_06925 [Gemmatimonadales bacterium]|nr:hypothetical protein [Gemmatimonadales bacterium]
MHSPFRTRGIIPTVTLALALAVALPALAAAKPEPGAKPRGFRMLASAISAMQINRIYCGLSSTGEICVNASGSSTVGGANWPRGTADQYIFNTGLQLAGVVSNPGGVWDGDTTGAFFFNPRGGGNGEQVQPIYNASDASDFANWPAAAYVPSTAEGDAGADLYSDLLQGTKQASQGDVWWVSWEGNPAATAGNRPHPLGVVVETRGMGWNFPSGNEDIIYYIYTFYNISSTNEADYVGIRQSMKDILLEQARDFQASNNAAFGISLPTGGYTLTDMYAAFGTDMDIANAVVNYSSVNLPFALGYTYVSDFAGESNWSFDANIFGPPFFPGAGFAGVKYLKSPTGPGEIQLFSNTVNTSASFRPIFQDASNTTQLWRYLSGNISTAAGDEACNQGDQTQTHICWINNVAPADMRFFQSSTELTLPPGGQGSIVVAYIFAAPVAVPGCPAPGCTDVKPGNPTILGSAQAMGAGGVNLVDSISGYAGFNDINADTVVSQNEFLVVNNSLLGKSLTAQAVFDSKFLLPFAPAAPAFFVIPGDNQVTIFWQPTESEDTGDPYYGLASNPANALYNPNYREFDIEGYRIYRGRVNNPAQLFLVAQFDYAGTIFNDYDAVVNPVNTCAPELNVYTDCPVAYSPVIPGQPRTVANPNNIVSPFLQTKYGDRLELATGTVLTTKMDTAVTGAASGGFPPLENTEVPFVFVDPGVRNNFNYYYVVTAFDINSLASGPSSLESPKSNPLAVTPQAPASNYANSTTFSTGIYGRNVALTSAGSPAPAIGASTGRFAGPMPAANAWTIGFTDFVQQVFEGAGNFAVRLDSITLGSSYETSTSANTAAPTTFHMSAVSGALSTPLTMVLYQDPTFNTASGAVTFVATQIDGTLAAIYGGSDEYFLKGQVTMQLVGTYYSNAYGRGCVNAAAGFDVGGGCSYQGPRWFAGPSPTANETMDNPNGGNPANFTTNTVNTALANNAGWNNAGELPGVSVIYNPQSYETVQTAWRQMEGIGSGAKRMADYNVYFGTGGKIDSVIDVTHNVPVPFDAFGTRDIDGDGTPEVDSVYNGGWGILNATNAPGSGLTASYDRRTELTIGDIGCVRPYKTYVVGRTGGIIACPGPVYFLTDSVKPGPTAFVTTSTADATNGARTAPVSTQQGFIMLLGGEIYQFGMPSTTPPADNSVWSVRDYVGAITGGVGFGGDEGPYAFANVPRPFTAVGAELRANYDVINQVNASTNYDLSQVHTVPDPYYVTSPYEVDWTSKIIKFVNLPTQATIRIYSSSGVLVRVLNYSAPTNGGMLDWNVRNRNNQIVASGVYFYHIESGNARHIGRMTIVNYAQ